jgi:uncharacterized protein YbjT (DUF2867 family)
MRALITGASGFVGHELSRLLQQHGVPVIAAVGPEPNQKELLRIAELRQRGLQKGSRWRRGSHTNHCDCLG